jgi:uncharacterized SAM-binding protein YcdF (DUF218 family)
MAPENGSAPAVRKKRRTGRIVLGLAGIALLGTVIFLLCIGRWLVVEDPLEKAQAIVVLSGSMPLRALEAAKLYREGYAPKVWLTHSSEPAAALAAMGIPYTGEDSYDQQILIHEGIPSADIRILDPPIVNTADEIKIVSATLERDKKHTAIIVTSKVHTRRTRILWQRIVVGREQAVIRAASDDPFEPKRWWRTTGDALDVVRELLGILNVWAGLPLGPAH